jgi:hypothetical protein
VVGDAALRLPPPHPPVYFFIGYSLIALARWFFYWEWCVHGAPWENLKRHLLANETVQQYITYIVAYSISSFQATTRR